MREKLLALMEYEGLRSGQLAARLDISPAVISHILADRNKPGFDLLQKILRTFPKINPDWLLLDAGEMLRSTERTASTAPALTSEASGVGGLFSNPAQPTAPKEVAADIKNFLPQASSNESKAIKRIVILYEDHTFESYAPARR